jgi:hypothetical protein
LPQFEILPYDEQQNIQVRLRLLARSVRLGATKAERETRFLPVSLSQLLLRPQEESYQGQAPEI